MKKKPNEVTEKCANRETERAEREGRQRSCDAEGKRITKEPISRLMRKRRQDSYCTVVHKQRLFPDQQ